MRPHELLIRCYAQRHGDQWVAVSLEFGLAAQGDSLAEVKQKLDEQLREYVYDALAGEDRAHARYLLKRRAPLSDFAKYYFLRLLCFFRGSSGHKSDRLDLFTETMPLQPA